MNITLNAYYEMLERHDWYFHYSDNNQIYLKGIADEVKLRDIRQKSIAHEELYDNYESHMFTGDPWKNVKTPKPERPE